MDLFEYRELLLSDKEIIILPSRIYHQQLLISCAIISKKQNSFYLKIIKKACIESKNL
jgi:hypothetical protein